MVATGDSTGAKLTQPAPVKLHPWRPKAEPLAWHRYIFGEYTTHEADDFDQTGCEWPGQADEPADPVSNQLLLFDDGWQPDAPAGDPIFWPGEGGQKFPEDDFVPHALGEVCASAGHGPEAVCCQAFRPFCLVFCGKFAAIFSHAPRSNA